MVFGFYSLDLIFDCLFIFGKVIDLLVFFITNAAITPCRLCIAKIIGLMRISQYSSWSYLLYFLFLYFKECFYYLTAHLVIVYNFILIYSIILYITQERTLNCKYIGNIKLFKECSSGWILVASSKATIFITKSNIILADCWRQ